MNPKVNNATLARIPATIVRMNPITRATMMTHWSTLVRSGLTPPPARVGPRAALRLDLGARCG
jgi:hypothetical protein